jgi:hypothetical protein
LFDECRTIWTLGRARDARSFHPLALPGPQIGGSGVLDVTRDQGDKLAFRQPSGTLDAVGHPRCQESASLTSELA